MNSFTDGSAFCPGAQRVPLDSKKHRRVYTSSNVCHSHEWRVDTASGKTLKNGMRVYTLSDRRSKKKIACIHGLRSEGVLKPLALSGKSSTWTVPLNSLVVLAALEPILRHYSGGNVIGCLAAHGARFLKDSTCNRDNLSANTFSTPGIWDAFI